MSIVPYIYSNFLISVNIKKINLIENYEILPKEDIKKILIMRGLLINESNDILDVYYLQFINDTDIVNNYIELSNKAINNYIKLSNNIYQFKTKFINTDNIDQTEILNQFFEKLIDDDFIYRFSLLLENDIVLYMIFNNSYLLFELAKNIEITIYEDTKYKDENLLYELFNIVNSYKKRSNTPIADFIKTLYFPYDNNKYITIEEINNNCKLNIDLTLKNKNDLHKLSENIIKIKQLLKSKKKTNMIIKQKSYKDTLELKIKFKNLKEYIKFFKVIYGAHLFENL